MGLGCDPFPLSNPRWCSFYCQLGGGKATHYGGRNGRAGIRLVTCLIEGLSISCGVTQVHAGPKLGAFARTVVSRCKSHRLDCLKIFGSPTILQREKKLTIMGLGTLVSKYSCEWYEPIVDSVIREEYVRCRVVYSLAKCSENTTLNHSGFTTIDCFHHAGRDGNMGDFRVRWNSRFFAVLIIPEYFEYRLHEIPVCLGYCLVLCAGPKFRNTGTRSPHIG